MLSLLATGIVLPEIIIRSSVSITSNLIASVSYLNTVLKGDPELRKLLQLSDILNEINIIHTYIEEKQYNIEIRSISMCLSVLEDTMKDLEKNIITITSKLQNHSKLWFHRLRSYDIEFEKEQIIILHAKMKSQFELLIKIANN